MKKPMMWVALVILLLAVGLIFRAGIRSSRTASAKEEFQEKWRFKAETINGALALSEKGTVYAASVEGNLFAVNSLGKLVWKTSLGATREAPAIAADGGIYVANSDQVFYAINPDGTVRWTRASGPYADRNSPWRAGALDDNYFYTTWRGSLRAVRLSDGTIAWTTGWGYEHAGSASIRPDGMLVYTGPGWLEAVDSEGKTVWYYPVPNPPISVDAVLATGKPQQGTFFLDSGIAVDKNGILYAASQGARLLAVSLDGTALWHVETGRQTVNYPTPVIAADGTIYFACGDGAIYALNPDGTQKWLLETGGRMTATPILAADGTLLLLAADALLAVSPEGKLLGKSSVAGGSASPTLAPDGTLYVATNQGWIIAFTTKHGGLMNSAWPKFQHDVANTGYARAF